MRPAVPLLISAFLGAARPPRQLPATAASLRDCSFHTWQKLGK